MFTDSVHVCPVGSLQRIIRNIYTVELYRKKEMCLWVTKERMKHIPEHDRRVRPLQTSSPLDPDQ